MKDMRVAFGRATCLKYRDLTGERFVYEYQPKKLEVNNAYQEWQSTLWDIRVTL